MEREGIFYFFEHGEDGEKLVLADNRNYNHDPLGTPVRYFPQLGIALNPSHAAQQGAAVVAAAVRRDGISRRPALAAAVTALERAAFLTAEAGGLAERYRRRQAAVHAYTEAYRRYCWPVHSLADFKLAPFHLLATEGCVHTDRTHVWHTEQLTELCAALQSVLLATPFRVVDLADETSAAEGVRWWRS